MLKVTRDGTTDGALGSTATRPMVNLIAASMVADFGVQRRRDPRESRDAHRGAPHRQACRHGPRRLRS